MSGAPSTVPARALDGWSCFFLRQAGLENRNGPRGRASSLYVLTVCVETPRRICNKPIGGALISAVTSHSCL